MIARISLARYPPHHFDAGLHIIRTELLPAFQQAAGYQGCCLLRHGKPGTGLAVVLWESEAAADDAAVAEKTMAAHVQLAGLGLAIETRQVYEVVVIDSWPATAATNKPLTTKARPTT
jgi:hypothetical protein